MCPTVSFYRYLYDTVGEDNLWGDRRKLEDAALRPRREENEEVAQCYHGTLVVGGAFDDTLDVDVTESEGLSDLTRTGLVSVTLTGTAKTSRASHAFAEKHDVNSDSVAVEDNE